MFGKVLYPIDLQEGELSQAGIKCVLEQVRKWQAKLVLLTVLPGFGMPLVASYFPKDAQKKATAAARQKMAAYIKTHIPEGVAVTSLICEGCAYEEILREAKKRRVDLIVIPSHERKGMDKFLLGSTAAKVVEHAHCSVLVLRNC